MGVGGVGARFEQISRRTFISFCRMVRLKLLTVFSPFAEWIVVVVSGVRGRLKVEVKRVLVLTNASRVSGEWG